ncbi:MAG: zinc-binding dehydrogenase, partial [Alphaproteobacteria bacterium]|nr:zinc-binding dehydrogenase [Alphaproteobacteria bacterium]
AEAAGADVVINYRESDVAAEVMAATADDGVDRIIEVAFGANLPITQAVLKDNGAIATYASDAAPTPTLPFYPMMQKNALLRWVFMYKIPDSAFEQARNDIMTWLSSGPTQHLVGKVFGLDETAAAHEFLESGQAAGTVVVATEA